jgi:two-component sensor histidine kinase
VLQKYPHDAEVAERIDQRVDRVLDVLAAGTRQVGEQLQKAQRSLERGPGHETNWVEVHDFLREVRARLQQMRRITDACLDLAMQDGQQRQLQRLRKNIESAFDLCRTLGG